MEGSRYVSDFRELDVYRESRLLAKNVFEISKGFPREEMYSLTDQIRRAARAVGAQIAEAWAKRRYIKHFISKLTDADGEQLETRHWVDCAADSGYLEESERTQLLESLQRIGRMLNTMISKAHLFCQDDQRFVCEPCLHPYTVDINYTAVEKTE